MIYFEARFVPALCTSSKFTMEDAVVAALASFRRGQQEIPITIHAGEGCRPENIREAVFTHGATRIGHGVSLQNDPELLKAVRDRGTVFEICLTSNLQTCTVPSAAAHPFRKFLDEQIRVTLNTDDPDISNLTLTHEFELAAREYHLKPAEVRGLLLNAAGAVFGETALQRELTGRFERLALI